MNQAERTAKICEYLTPKGPRWSDEESEVCDEIRELLAKLSPQKALLLLAEQTSAAARRL